MPVQSNPAAVDEHQSLTAAELSLLISRFAEPTPGDCPVCHLPMQVTAMARGVISHACPDAVRGAFNADLPVTDRDAWYRHYNTSRTAVTYRGNATVVRALVELRQLRGAAGEDMTVPAGTVAFPHGHGKTVCWRYYVHAGGDRWDEHVDHEYTHNPDHARAPAVT
jgi:hypothetical protein